MATPNPIRAVCSEISDLAGIVAENQSAEADPIRMSIKSSMHMTRKHLRIFKSPKKGPGLAVVSLPKCLECANRINSGVVYSKLCAMLD